MFDNKELRYYKEKVSMKTQGGGGYSHMAIWVCAAGKGMVFKPFSLV